MMIRDVCLEDSQDTIDTEHENFSAEEVASLNDMKERILTIPDTFLVAEIDGKICGYVEGSATCQRYLIDDLFHQVVSNPTNGGLIVVTSLSVTPDSKGRGIGMALLATTKDLATAQKRIGVILTRHENLISHYERNGFSDEGESESTHGSSSWHNMVREPPMTE